MTDGILPCAVEAPPLLARTNRHDAATLYRYAKRWPADHGGEEGAP